MMTESDKTAFAQILGGLAEVYGKELSARALRLYFAVMQAARLSVEDVERAAIGILASRKYATMPPPAEFLEQARGGCVEDMAEVEAGKVLDAVARHGGYNSVAFDCPTTQAVIEQACGGWVKLCETVGSEANPERWWRKDFVKTWAAYRRQGVEKFGALPGRTEIANAAAGFSEFNPPPRLVGDAKKAQAVKENLPALEVVKFLGGLKKSATMEAAK